MLKLQITINVGPAIKQIDEVLCTFNARNPSIKLFSSAIYIRLEICSQDEIYFTHLQHNI
jgi:hypothetical protein